MEKNKRDEYFIIAEILACISFILHTICVVTAERGGSFAPAWITNFNAIYWLKTVSAIIGFYCFFISGVFNTKDISRYISISTLIILLYSLPIINTVFLFIFAIIFKIIRGSTFEYEDRILIQTIWFIPLIFIIGDLCTNLSKKRKNNYNGHR